MEFTDSIPEISLLPEARELTAREYRRVNDVFGLPHDTRGVQVSDEFIFFTNLDYDCDVFWHMLDAMDIAVRSVNRLVYNGNSMIWTRRVPQLNEDLELDTAPVAQIALKASRYRRMIRVMKKTEIRTSGGAHASKGRYYRYLDGIDVNSNEAISFGLIFDDKEAPGVNPNINDIVDFAYDKETNGYRVNPRWHNNLIQAGVASGSTIIRLLDWVDWRIAGVSEPEDFALQLFLRDFRFYDGFAKHNQTSITLTNEQLGFDSTPLINDLNPEDNPLDGYVRITGRARLMPRVIDGQLTQVPIVGNDEETFFTVVETNLGSIKQAIEQYEHDQQLGQLLKWAKQQIAQNRLISQAELAEMAEQLGVTIDYEYDQILHDLTMHKSYDPEYYQVLKDRHDESTPIYYGKSGFLFRVNGSFVWERPVAGSATYVFEAKFTVKELVAKLEQTEEFGKMAIIKNEEVQTALGYKGRAIHPKEKGVVDDEEKEKFLKRWTNDVLKLVHE